MMKNITEDVRMFIALLVGVLGLLFLVPTCFCFMVCALFHESTAKGLLRGLTGGK